LFRDTIRVRPSTYSFPGADSQHLPAERPVSGRRRSRPNSYARSELSRPAGVVRGRRMPFEQFFTPFDVMHALAAPRYPRVRVVSFKSRLFAGLCGEIRSAWYLPIHHPYVPNRSRRESGLAGAAVRRPQRKLTAWSGVSPGRQKRPKSRDGENLTPDTYFARSPFMNLPNAMEIHGNTLV